MDNQNYRQQQEYEFVMEGITTRMQTALEKMSSSLRLVCIVGVITLLLVIAGGIVSTVIWMDYTNDIRSGVIASEEVFELGPGAHD